jgi:hypothetical protein
MTEIEYLQAQIEILIKISKATIIFEDRRKQLASAQRYKDLAETDIEELKNELRALHESYKKENDEYQVE